MVYSKFDLSKPPRNAPFINMLLGLTLKLWQMHTLLCKDHNPHSLCFVFGGFWINKVNKSRNTSTILHLKWETKARMCHWFAFSTFFHTKMKWGFWWIWFNIPWKTNHYLGSFLHLRRYTMTAFSEHMHELVVLLQHKI